MLLVQLLLYLLVVVVSALGIAYVLLRDSEWRLKRRERRHPWWMAR